MPMSMSMPMPMHGGVRGTEVHAERWSTVHVLARSIHDLLSFPSTPAFLAFYVLSSSFFRFPPSSPKTYTTSRYLSLHCNPHLTQCSAPVWHVSVYWLYLSSAAQAVPSAQSVFESRQVCCLPCVACDALLGTYLIPCSVGPRTRAGLLLPSTRV